MITDLTGTKWRFNSICDYMGDGTTNYFFRIIFTSDYAEIEGNTIRCPIYTNNSLMATIVIESSNAVIGIYLKTTDQLYQNLSLTDGEGWYKSVNDTIQKQSTPPTITITGGADVTNANLISFMQTNAEQIIEPTGNEYTLTQNLTNLTNGNITLTITADEGYSLPAQAGIVVTGGTIVSYDDTTGELVVTAGTTAVEVTCESAVSTIRFEIDGVLYDAGDGMTWAQWCDSAYNTDGYYYTDTPNWLVFVSGGGNYVGYDSANNVSSSEEIIANTQYVLNGGGND